MAQIKPWFKIRPNNRKLLKSSKVRKYFSEVELLIAKELTEIMLPLMVEMMVPPARPWFTLKEKKCRKK